MEAIAVVALVAVAVYFFFKHSNGKVTDTSRSNDDDWSYCYALYYVANEMRLSADGAMPGTLRALAAGLTHELQVQQSLLVSLQWYLRVAYRRDRSPADWPKAASAARDFLKAEVLTASSLIALKRFVRRQSEIDASESVIASDVQRLAAAINSDDELRVYMRNKILKEHVAELFEGAHGESISAYAAKVLAQQEALLM